MNPIKPSFIKSLLNRTFFAVILFIVAIPSMIIGDWAIIIFTALGLFFAVNEYLNVKKDALFPLPIRLFVYVMSIMLVNWVFLYNNIRSVDFSFQNYSWQFYQSMGQLEVSTVILTIMTGTLFLSAITDKRFKVQDATFVITMTTLIALSFQGFLHLRFFPEYIYNELEITRPLFAHSLLLLYVVIGTFFTDIGAYFIGTLFGKHKMNVRVSSNKTWEGFYGGVIISFVTSFTFAIVMDMLGTPLLPFLTLSNVLLIVFISLVMPLVATLGDFIFSIIKREFGVKNFSSLLGEHGGILDRIDSFAVTCLTVSLIITIIYDWMIILQ
jgi:phosphatidate cytidylyltransferase